MISPFNSRKTRGALLALLTIVAAVHAFPPAPYYTLYGTVRDQVGQTIRAEGAVLILLKDGAEIARTPVTSGVRLDQNYELAVRLDAARSGTTAYTDKAVPAQGQFSLAVDLNGQLFYPIEVTGTLTAGKGGERVRLDLNLGEDSDGDGMPDVWEEWQLYHAGHLPGDDGRWALNLLDKAGDFDRDGQTNYAEYLAGTFAGDATETFKLDIKDKTAAGVRFEFFQITGKTYTIERTSDMKTWSRVPFTVGAPGEGTATHTAATVGITSAYSQTDAAGKNFYRLTVR